MNRLASAALDVAVVLVFVAVGRSAHDESLWGVLGTAAPFLFALAVGRALTIATPWPADGLRGGLVVWGTTWVGGLLLRGLLFGQGTAPAFVVVAGVALALGLLGWRLVAILVRRSQAKKNPGTPATSRGDSV